MKPSGMNFLGKTDEEEEFVGFDDESGEGCESSVDGVISE